MNGSNAEDYYQDYPGGPFHKKLSPKNGGNRDPKKCTHPDDRGRNCSYCGVYVRGDDMG